MIAIGSYFVFITYAIGMIFAAIHFSPEGELIYNETHSTGITKLSTINDKL